MPGWDLSCKDWEQRLRDGRPPIPDLPLFRDEADTAVEFFKLLRLPDVPGNPTMAEAAGDWAFTLVAVLFGSYDPAAQVRYIDELFALIAKKNSKTTYLGAGLMLTALFMNRRPRAEFMFVGPTQAIADLAYSQTDGMIALDPELRKRFKAREHLKEIRDLITGAKLKIKTFDLSILTGPRPAGTFVDELHLLGKNAATPKILRQLRGGRQAYPEAFMVIATTQSDDRPAGAFKEELEAARAIRDGNRTGKTLPVLYEFPERIARDRAEWSNPRNWPMVMPNLGRSLRIDALEQDFAAEAAKGDGAVRLWASQHLNVEIGVGLHSDRWPGADFWEARADRNLTLESLIDRCELTVVGVDDGGLDDLLGFAVLGRERGTRDWLSWSRAWAHKSVFERRKSEASRLLDFERDGDLVIVERLADAAEEVADLVEQVDASGLLPREKAVGADPYGPDLVIDALDNRGFDRERVIGVPQGWKMAGAIKNAELRLADGTMRHADQPLMDWCVGNAKLEQRGNAVLITKQVAGAGKIDPLMALLNAVALMALNPETTRSVYEDRPLLVL